MKFESKQLARTALIAAIYTTICLALPFLSYGSVQVRFSEALTLLPAIMPQSVVGITLGCFLTNLIGTFLGTTLPLDVLFGTIATFLAALATSKLGNLRWKGLAIPAMIPPVLFNAVIIGAELTYLFYPTFTLQLFLFNAISVGIGQLIACTLGVMLVWFIEKNPNLKKYFSNKL